MGTDRSHQLGELSPTTTGIATNPANLPRAQAAHRRLATRCNPSRCERSLLRSAPSKTGHLRGRRPSVASDSGQRGNELGAGGGGPRSRDLRRFGGVLALVDSNPRLGRYLRMLDHLQTTAPIRAFSRPRTRIRPFANRCSGSRGAFDNGPTNRGETNQLPHASRGGGTVSPRSS